MAEPQKQGESDEENFEENFGNEPRGGGATDKAEAKAEAKRPSAGGGKPLRRWETAPAISIDSTTATTNSDEADSNNSAEIPEEGPRRAKSQLVRGESCAKTRATRAELHCERAALLKQQQLFLKEATPEEETAFWHRKIFDLSSDKHKPVSPNICPKGYQPHEEVEWWRQRIEHVSIPTQHRVKGGQSPVEHKPPRGASHEEELNFWQQKISQHCVPVDQLIERADKEDYDKELEEARERQAEKDRLEERKRQSVARKEKRASIVKKEYDPDVLAFENKERLSQKDHHHRPRSSSPDKKQANFGDLKIEVD